MRYLWNWVALTAGIYGTVCLGGALYPAQIRKAGLEVQLPDLKHYSRENQYERGLRGEHGELPLRLDFKKLSPGIVTIPNSPVEVRPSDGGPGILQWKIVEEWRSFHTLSIPFRLQPKASVLRLRLRAQPETLVHVDLREEDGTLYAVERMAKPEWEDLTIKLDEFKLARFQRDENERLDPEQVVAFAMLALTPHGEDISAWKPGARLERRFEQRRDGSETQPRPRPEAGSQPPAPGQEQREQPGPGPEAGAQAGPPPAPGEGAPPGDGTAPDRKPAPLPVIEISDVRSE